MQLARAHRLQSAAFSPEWSGNHPGHGSSSISYFIAKIKLPWKVRLPFRHARAAALRMAGVADALPYRAADLVTPQSGPPPQEEPPPPARPQFP
jgi:hypothetical protein